MSAACAFEDELHRRVCEGRMILRAVQHDRERLGRRSRAGLQEATRLGRFRTRVFLRGVASAGLQRKPDSPATVVPDDAIAEPPGVCRRAKDQPHPLSGVPARCFYSLKAAGLSVSLAQNEAGFMDGAGCWMGAPRQIPYPEPEGLASYGGFPEDGDDGARPRARPWVSRQRGGSQSEDAAGAENRYQVGAAHQRSSRAAVSASSGAEIA